MSAFSTDLLIDHHTHTSFLLLFSFFFAHHFCVAVVLDVLRGPLAGNARVAEAGLGAIQNLVANDNIILRIFCACEGERFCVISTDLLIDLHTHSPFLLFFV